MDLAGGVKLVYKIDFSKYDQIYTTVMERDEAKRQAVSIILKNIDNRISAFGVSDYSARQQKIGEETFLVVEIGGVHSIETAKEVIGRTVELEFKVPTKDADKPALEAQRKELVQTLFADVRQQPDQMATLAANRQSDEIYYAEFQDRDIDSLSPLFHQHREQILAVSGPTFFQESGLYQDQIEGYTLLRVDSVVQTKTGEVGLDKFTALAGQYKKTYGISTGNTHQETIGTIRYNADLKELQYYSDIKASSFGAGNEGYQIIGLYDVSSSEAETMMKQLETTVTISGAEIFVSKAPQWVVAVNSQTNEILNGAFFSYATPGVNQFGKPVVSIYFNEKGKEIFCNLTKEYQNQQMAIFVGGILQTAPVINEPICAGSAQIDGSFTRDDAKILSDSLNEGALPAPLILSQEEKISPVLGEGAINGAFLAGAIGLLLMTIFLLVFYGWQSALVGIVVMVAFLVYSLALFKLIDYAFSLSAIAAIILTLAMGIDANIIIYERLKEELATGKSWNAAIDVAYERSWLAIRDGNVTNIIIYVVLFGMGMSIFKGFGFAGLLTGLLILVINVPLTKILLKLFKK